MALQQPVERASHDGAVIFFGGKKKKPGPGLSVKGSIHAFPSGWQMFPTDPSLSPSQGDTSGQCIIRKTHLLHQHALGVDRRGCEPFP
jgi:hypothetical protein